MKQLQNNLKIGIYALGLIGGSIYKSLVKKDFKNIFAYSHNEETIAKIKQEGFDASNDINILNNCELIFVCTPISKTVEAIKEVFSINKDAIIVDVASLKENILNEINKIVGCKFIASHPMAGTENSGFNNSFADLFVGANWVVIPSKNVTNNDVDILKNIIVLTGAKIVEMDSKEHDKAVALISHLPMLISQSLVLSAKDNQNALLLASSGFRDTTRLAMSNQYMAKDMLTLNKSNIKLALNDIIENANRLLNSEYFNDNIDEIISLRKKLYNNQGNNNL